MEFVQVGEVTIGILLGFVGALLLFNYQNVILGTPVHHAQHSFRKLVKNGLTDNSLNPKSYAQDEKQTAKRLRRLGFSEELAVGEFDTEVELPEELQCEIQHLSDLVVSDFVTSWFKNLISTNLGFPTAVNELIQGILSRFVSKLIQSDSVSFVFLDVCTAFRMLFRLFVDARGEVVLLHPEFGELPRKDDSSSNYLELLKARSPLLMRSLMLSNLMHPACIPLAEEQLLDNFDGSRIVASSAHRQAMQRLRKEAYLRHVSDALVPHLLLAQDKSCASFTTLVREVLTCCVLTPALDSVCPDLLNNILLSAAASEHHDEPVESQGGQARETSRDEHGLIAEKKPSRQVPEKGAETGLDALPIQSKSPPSSSGAVATQEEESSLAQTNSGIQTDLGDCPDGARPHLLTACSEVDAGASQRTTHQPLLSDNSTREATSPSLSTSSEGSFRTKDATHSSAESEPGCRSMDLTRTSTESFHSLRAEGSAGSIGRLRSKAVPDISKAQQFMAIWGVHRVAASVRSAQLTVDTQRKEGSTPYVAYVIECGKVGWEGRTLWTVKRRFSQFYALHHRLRKSVKDFKLKLPSRQVFKFVSAFDRALVESRRRDLQGYVTGLLKHPWAYSNPDVKAFFAPPGYEELKGEVSQVREPRLLSGMRRYSVAESLEGTPSFSRSARFSVTDYEGLDQQEENSQRGFALDNWVIEQAKEIGHAQQPAPHAPNQRSVTPEEPTTVPIGPDTAHLLPSRVENSLFRVLQEVLHVRELGLFRRKLIAVLRTIVRYSFLGRLYSFLELMGDPSTKSKQWAVTLQFLRELLWPGGSFIETAEDYTAQEKKDLYFNSRQLLLESLPKPLLSLVGTDRAVEAAELLHEFFQYPEQVDNLLYTVLDLLLVRTYGLPIEQIHNAFLREYEEPTKVSELVIVDPPSE